MYCFRKPSIVWSMFLLLLSIKSNGQSIFGKYESNWHDILVIYPDSSFSLHKVSQNAMDRSSPGVLTGKLSITPQHIYFTTMNAANETTAFWTCHSLKRKSKKLIRPLHCQPTHRLLIFQKVKGFNE